LALVEQVVHQASTMEKVLVDQTQCSQLSPASAEAAVAVDTVNLGQQSIAQAELVAAVVVLEEDT
jgi:hypothetical protein